jgi:competence protein ComEC
MLTIVMLGGSLGVTAGTVRSLTSAAPVIGSETGPVMLEGWIQEIEPGQKGVRLNIRVHSISGMSPSDWPLNVRVTHMSRLEVSAGRFVRCWSVLRPPPAPSMQGEYDFRRQAWFEKLGGVGYVQGRCRGGALGAPPGALNEASLWLAGVRRNLSVAVNEAAGERAAALPRRS